MRHIPNFITSLNLASGFAAIILAAAGSLEAASWLIAAAMIFDFFDGFSARLLKAYSDLGRELDSLADVVSFGVAPAIILFKYLSNTIPAENSFNSAALLVAAVMPVFAALRLAKFNIDPSQSVTFRGMPTPANAIAVITLVISAEHSGSELITGLTRSGLFLVIYTLVLSALMVSRIPLLSLKMKNFGWKGNEGRYIMAILISAALIISGSAALPLVIPLYIAASLSQMMF